MENQNSKGGGQDTDFLEHPTAEAVARALIASAKVLGEDPLAMNQDMRGAGKCRWPALEALKIIYPDTPWSAFGRMVGTSVPQQRTNGAKKTAWWPGLGLRAVEAALEALEPL